jgi:thiol-disulfide isomerase/thioredoxin
MQKNTNKLVLNLLGLLLLTAAAMKGWQLLVEPVANKDIFSNRAFLIFAVEFELALGIWLISGLFRKAAWLAALLCFGLFSAITFYKAITGADSCGCFGSVHVNPWVTLFAIDIPAIITLIVFRPKNQKLFDWPSIPRFATIFSIGIIILTVAGCVLSFNEPGKITTDYEVLEPGTWIGKELPIIDYIDIGKQLEKGNWLVLFYHYDCPDCVKAIAELEDIANDLAGNEDILKIALVEVPPYGPKVINKNCTLGQLDNSKEWFVTTPAAILLDSGKVKSAWESSIPDFSEIIGDTGIFRNIGTIKAGNNLTANKRNYKKEVVGYGVIILF